MFLMRQELRNDMVSEILPSSCRYSSRRLFLFDLGRCFPYNHNPILPAFKKRRTELYLKSWNAYLSAFMVILIILCVPVMSQAGPSKKITKTKIIKYIPKIPSEKREGSCWTNSNIIQRSDVWRCMIGNEIFDPCYTAQDKTTIVCDAKPDIKKPSGFVLKLTKPLPASDVPNGPSSSASMVELEDGTICDAISGASGATDGVRTERISYSCRMSSKNIVIFGALITGKVWIAEKGILVEQKTNNDLPPMRVKNLRKVKIRTVWQ